MGLRGEAHHRKMVANVELKMIFWYSPTTIYPSSRPFDQMLLPFYFHLALVRGRPMFYHYGLHTFFESILS
jgi:hypothetical protein